MPATPPDARDLLILGADAAGAIAALSAARRGLSVCLVEGDEPDDDGLDWIAPSGLKLCAELGLQPQSCDAQPFERLTLLSSDGQRRIELLKPELGGWLVERRKLTAALTKAACAAGAVPEPCAFRLQCHESGLSVETAAGERRTGRLALIAGPRYLKPAQAAGALMHARPHATTTCTLLEMTAGSAAPQLVVMPPAQRRGPCAFWVSTGRTARLRIFGSANPAEAETELARVLRACETAGLPLPLPKFAPAQYPLPAGDALDVESNVGKAVLLIGLAGGFISATSFESFTTAARSAVLAVEIAAQALKAAVPQDELSGYDAAWRAELADSLRPLHTDLALLNPLLFNNEQMAMRLARAMLLGQPF